MADRFVCAGCDAPLTVPLARVALPVVARLRDGHARWLPPLMAAGTYAVDPEPSGPPWRAPEPDELAARGVFVPVPWASFGLPGTFVTAPGDTCGTVLVPEPSGYGCCGFSGGDGPNLRCADCGSPVGTRIDDCYRWQSVRLAPDAVRLVPVDGLTDRVLDWETLIRQAEAVPPLVPAGYWDSRWEAAAGEALAHLVAASGGAAVAVPDGLLADLFRRPLARLLPDRPPTRALVPAGPGLPAPDRTTDLALVPRHPQTGEAWQPSGVPLAAEVWLHLAFHNERLLVPATGRLPTGLLRDDPLPLRPHQLFRPDSHVFLHTLARLPAVREPWLRAIHDRVKGDGPHPRPL